MKSTLPTIIFFGNERLSTAFEPQGAPTLEALLAAGYKVAAVVSHFEPGRSRKARRLEIEAVAQAHNIPLLLPQKLSEVTHELAALQADCAVLVAYGKLIPQSVIDIFPKGIINIHPSLLPKYRGPTPIEQAMLDGTTETGVSLMQLVKEMDAGPVFAQSRVPLDGTETKQALTQKLQRLGAEMLVANLSGIISGELVPTPQNEAEATYCQLLTKTDGWLDLSKSATMLERQVRAFAGWPKSTLTLFNLHRVVVTSARVAASAADGTLVVACGNHSYLELLEVIAPSGRKMSGADFLRGYSPKN